MKAVVDTNVVAYYVLGTPEFDAEVREFWRRVEDPIAPALWEAELANVIWMSVRGDVLTKEERLRSCVWQRSSEFTPFSVRKLWQGALQRGLESGVAVYDTLFVELADREQLPLATFDKKVLTTYPDIAKRPKDLM